MQRAIRTLCLFPADKFRHIGVFFCGMILLPVVNASPISAKCHSCELHKTISSANRFIHFSDSIGKKFNFVYSYKIF